MSKIPINSAERQLSPRTHSCRHNCRDSGSHRRLGSAGIDCPGARSGNERARA